MMPEMILLPNGQVLITNGALTGYAAVASIGITTGNSNADHPMCVVSTKAWMKLTGFQFHSDTLHPFGIAG
jgi:hypothetical protein